MKPFKLLKKLCYRVWYRITSFYWYLKSRFIYRYHLINLNGVNGHTYGWIDKDNAMFMACFKLLEDYVEQEDPFNVLDWEWHEDHRKAKKEITDLYDWWKIGRHVEQLKRMEVYEKEQEMLTRLIKVRKYLWT